MSCASGQCLPQDQLEHTRYGSLAARLPPRDPPALRLRRPRDPREPLPGLRADEPHAAVPQLLLSHQEPLEFHMTPASR